MLTGLIWAKTKFKCGFIGETRSKGQIAFNELDLQNLNLNAAFQRRIEHNNVDSCDRSKGAHNKEEIFQTENVTRVSQGSPCPSAN